MDNDMRHSREFILRVKGVYTEAELLRKDYLTFFRMLNESVETERETIRRMEEQNK